MLQGHGDNGYQYGISVVADFSSNVWYGGEPAGLKEYLFSEWSRINRYPEVMAESLARKIAAYHHVAEGQVLVCNGATESIYLAAQALRGKRSLVLIPSFSEYADACAMNGHTIGFVDEERWSIPGEAEKGELLSHADLCWIANPNNPTGAVAEGLAGLIREHPDKYFVVDEAFIEFSRGASSVVSLTSEYANLIVLRSLTKAFSVPGLRLGYIVAAPKTIALLQTCKQPWSVNVLAAAAGHYIFDHYETVQPPIDKLLKDKALFVAALMETGLMVRESATHFFLCELRRGDACTAAMLQKWLLEEKGILIRDAGNFRGLSPYHFRVATLSAEKNLLLINAFIQWQQQSC